MTENFQSYYVACQTVENNLDEILDTIVLNEFYLKDDMKRILSLSNHKMIEPRDIDRFEKHYILKEKNYISNPNDVPLEDFELADLLVSRTDSIKISLGISNVE